MTRFPSPASVAKDWWNSCIAADVGVTRQARAQLRRATSVTDALGLRATHDLHLRLAAVGHDLRERVDGPDRLALIAVALAHVTEDLGESAAIRFGSGKPTPTLSGLRFDAIIRSTEPRQLMRPLARALRIIRGGANVSRLAGDLYWWGDRVRTRWCFEYHGATDAIPITKETEK